MNQAVIFLQHGFLPKWKFFSDIVWGYGGGLKNLPLTCQFPIFKLHATHMNHMVFLGLFEGYEILFQPFPFRLQPVDS